VQPVQPCFSRAYSVSKGPLAYPKVGPESWSIASYRVETADFSVKSPPADKAEKYMHFMGLKGQLWIWLKKHDTSLRRLLHRRPYSGRKARYFLRTARQEIISHGRKEKDIEKENRQEIHGEEEGEQEKARQPRRKRRPRPRKKLPPRKRRPRNKQ